MKISEIRKLLCLVVLLLAVGFGSFATDWQNLGIRTLGENQVTAFVSNDIIFINPAEKNIVHLNKIYEDDLTRLRKECWFGKDTVELLLKFPTVCFSLTNGYQRTDFIYQCIERDDGVLYWFEVWILSPNY